MFKGLTVPDVIEKKALFAYGANKEGETIGGGKVVIARTYILDILREFKKSSYSSQIVPEKYPILRVLQIVACNWRYFDRGLKKQ